MRRILSVWSPRWPITSHRLRTNSGPGARSAEAAADGARPFALVQAVKGARRLAEVDEAASAAGLWAGQKLADAMALEPALASADFDPEADARALRRLADACARFSPSVAVDAPDGLYLDVTGAAHLWGGEAGMLRTVEATLGRWGVPVRLGLADTAGAAWALARFGDGLEIAAPGTQAERLAGLPVEALRADEAAAALRRLGLKTVGQAAGLPRAQLARRFDPRLLLRLDQALGRADEALVFRRPPSPWIQRARLVEPVSTADDFARVVGDLASALGERLAAEGRGGRRFEAAFHRVDGQVVRLRIGTALPSRGAPAIARLFAPKLETVDPGFGVEVVTLEAQRVEPLAARQQDLTASPDAGDDLAALVDRLSNRLGEDRVWRPSPEESHAPERAVARRPAAGPSEGSWDPGRPRPLRLLRPPEPIEAMAPVPDDPPVVFTWRGVRRRVRRAEGPERIAQEWWRDAAADPDPDRVRDYYRVEDAEGGRFWLFRAGLYTAAEPPRWYLHGLFG